jgi:hypothetical protein
MRQVTITLAVTKCHDCPHKGSNVFGEYECTLSDAHYDARAKIYDVNRNGITETCPLFELSIEV